MGNRASPPYSHRCVDEKGDSTKVSGGTLARSPLSAIARLSGQIAQAPQPPPRVSLRDASQPNGTPRSVSGSGFLSGLSARGNTLPCVVSPERLRLSRLLAFGVCGCPTASSVIRAPGGLRLSRITPGSRSVARASGGLRLSRITPVSRQVVRGGFIHRVRRSVRRSFSCPGCAVSRSPQASLVI